jgi:hypothetical protein
LKVFCCFFIPAPIASIDEIIGAGREQGNKKHPLPPAHWSQTASNRYHAQKSSVKPITPAVRYSRATGDDSGPKRRLHGTLFIPENHAISQYIPILIEPLAKLARHRKSAIIHIGIKLVTDPGFLFTKIAGAKNMLRKLSQLYSLRLLWF